MRVQDGVASVSIRWQLSRMVNIMKVLLMGEFSSLHKYLKEGLLELGVDVTLVANGDGWKDIKGADGRLFEQGNNTIDRLLNMFLGSFIKAKEYRDYDVVQIIKPWLYPKRINTKILQMVKKNNRCFSLVAAGEDYALLKSYLDGKFDYYLYDYDLDARDKYRDCRAVATENKIVEMSDIIIPSLYEYSIGYENNNVSEVIPFPINVSEIMYKENKVSGKIVFFHGLNREKAKGTPLIREALERLQREYPDEVEVIIDGHLPFDKYTRIMSKANVVIDQCCTYGYGINACIAMAQGKVVMAPCRNELLHSFGIENSPIIHLMPDSDYIYNQLVRIVENKTDIPLIGDMSRKYVESVHNHIKVAERYVATWKSTGLL